MLALLRADSVPIVEEYDEATFVALKCLDADGHRIEGTGNRTDDDRCQREFGLVEGWLLALCGT